MNIRRLLVLAGIIAAALLGASQASKLDDVYHTLAHARWYLLILVIPAQVWSYYASAKYYDGMLRHHGYRLSFARLYKASLAVNFVQSAVPAAGVSGATFLSSVLREVRPGTISLIHILKYIFTYAAFLVVLIFGFLCLFFGGGIAKISVRFTLLLQLGIIIGGAAILLILLGKKSRTVWIAEHARRGINRVSKSLRISWRLSEKSLMNFIDEFYVGAGDIRRHPKRWRAPFTYSLMFLVAEIVTFYIVTAAMGFWLNPGAVITAYTLANIASLVSPVTGGVGVYEATMIATLSAMGVPVAAAFSMTITYRLLQFLLFLPPGLYYYRKLIHES